MQIDLQHRAADSELMRSAALGESEALAELRRRNVLFAQRDGLCWAVSEDGHGRQSAILSEHVRGGGGMNHIVKIPASWRIESVSLSPDQEQIVLAAADGRVLAARPEQFRLLRSIRSTDNPDYEAQLEDDFLKLPTKRRGEADTYVDGQGGEWTYNTQIGGYWLTREAAEDASDGAPLPGVCCEAENRAELLEMLPEALRRLARLDVYADLAAEYLWNMGSEEEREALGREEFRALLHPDSVVFGYYGDIELWMAEEDGELFDGYSPTVYVDRNDRAVEWAMNG